MPTRTPTKTRKPAGSGLSLTLDYRLIAGTLLVFLGLGMLVLGAYHAFGHGTCSTTGYAGNLGPVPHCAKGIGWWAGLLVLGIFVVLGGGGLIAMRSATSTPGWHSPASTAGAVLAAAIGVGGAFGIAAGISSGIGKVPAPSTAIAGGSGVGTLSAAQIRANRVRICQDLVTSERLVSAGVKSSLTSQCQANPAAAQKRLTVEAKAAAVSYAAAQCKQGVAGAGAGLPVAAQAALAAQCGQSANSGGAASTAGTSAIVCQQVVKAQVPAAAQQAALAACPKG